MLGCSLFSLKHFLLKLSLFDQNDVIWTRVHTKSRHRPACELWGGLLEVRNVIWTNRKQPQNSREHELKNKETSRLQFSYFFNGYWTQISLDSLQPPKSLTWQENVLPKLCPINELLGESIDFLFTSAVSLVIEQFEPNWTKYSFSTETRGE